MTRGRRRAAAAAVTVALLAAPAALAHPPAPGYRSAARAIEPPLPHVVASVVDRARVRLQNGSGRDVVVLGYEGRPWRRAPAGATREWHAPRVHAPTAPPPQRRRQVVAWR